MRRFLLSLFWVGVFVAFAHLALADDAATPDKSAAADKASSFMKDLAKARETLLGTAGDKPFARGFMVALFEPVFLAAMFCMGLWAGQLSEKLKAIWALPLLSFGAMVLGAFITVYHTEWKPDLATMHKSLTELQSTDAVAIVIGLIFGAVVAADFMIPPVLAFVVAIIGGLALGFSQVGGDAASHFDDHKSALLPFWFGFGLTGLVVNIFGIGFETFFESINLKIVTRLAGVATVVLAFFFGTKVF